MKRDIFKQLQTWASSTIRTPLIVKGARQVGKSWAIRQFGTTFTHFIEINFEKHQTFKQIFQGDIQVDKLLEKLSLYSNQPITAAKPYYFLMKSKNAQKPSPICATSKKSSPNYM